MRQQFRLAALGLSILFISTVTLAQQMFAPPPPKQTQPAFPVPQVMSPSDFSGKVDTLSQQTRDRTTQQAAETLPKIQPAPPSTRTTPPTAASTQSPSPQAPATTYQPVQAASTPAPSRAPAAISPAPAPSSNSQVYTGFGAGNTQQPAQTDSGKNKGWNIQY